MVQANRMRAGNVIIYNGDLCRVLSVTHLTPGNLRAMVQAKMRRIKDSVQLENRFRATEEVEMAYLEEHEMEYLYDDGGRYHLMNTSTYEQIEMDHEMFGDAIQYILPNTKVKITFYEGTPIGVDLPTTVDLKVMDAEPSVKRQTASASYKKCTVETGLTVMVPPFVEAGDRIRIKTEDGEYVERV
ncbi:MAG: elongation factor P [Proteobacteria bacterium]|nr:elongation factor P [Pseudomonadota bacterium]